jgi:hypothetical protein
VIDQVLDGGTPVNCAVRAAASWDPVSGPALVSAEFVNEATGWSSVSSPTDPGPGAPGIEIGVGGFSPLNSGRDRWVVRFTLTDSAGNVLAMGSGHANLVCGAPLF